MSADAKPGAAPPLWQQLQHVAALLDAVRQGSSATAALAGVSPALRPGVQALLFHVLRNLGRADALCRRLASRPPPPAAHALLRVALALAWRADAAPYEPFTLVDQAVEAAKRNPSTRPQANFINACLRRFLREQTALVRATDAEPEARWNHPRWWIDRLRQDHPQHWQSILEASNTQPPLSLRVNARRATLAQALATLRAAGLPASALGAHGVQLGQPVPVSGIPGFTEGVLSVQDGAAQLAAPLLLGAFAEPPQRILDACAAPGGKTAHLLEMADADVTALDVDAQRGERIHDTLGRLGLQARVVAADAAQPADWWDGQPFDAILLDAPCTASGIVRRHPDVRWLRRESDIAQLVAQQARLLAALWPLLRPGGHLLYCTCSVFRAEGEGQMQTFVAHNRDAFLRPAPGHLLPQSGAKPAAVPDNLLGDHDGFFYALLGKRPAAGSPTGPPARGG